MDSNPSPAKLSSDANYTFAFNDRNFSDRVLKVEVFSDFPASNPGGEVQKRRKLETIANGDEAVHGVKTIYVSSPILAAKSPFFYKLFSNGMRESNQQEATLQIHVSEEAAFMDLLSFIYSGDLATTTAPDLLKVLIAADKFEVASCMKYCSHLLRNLPMTCESALFYLDLPSSVSMGEAVRPLTDAARQFLAAHYKDLTKFHEEVLLNLPLHGIEAVLSSDDLQVPSEDAVFEFVLKWAKKHYPILEDRRQVFGSRLSQLIRFPYMTCQRLGNVLTCTDFQTELVSEVVNNALRFKADTDYRHRSLAAKASGFTPRAYSLQPIKVIELEFPRQHCLVYLDLERDKCSQLFPSGRIRSQAFFFGGQGFYLRALCCRNQQSSDKFFGLSLGMLKHENEPVISCTVWSTSFL